MRLGSASATSLRRLIASSEPHRAPLFDAALEEHVSVAFLTVQGARHRRRSRVYQNETVSIRVGASVGSCAAEPGQVAFEEVRDCVGRSLGDLLWHPQRPVRTAALDAAAMMTRPHEGSGAEVVVIPAGSSLDKSLARARAVVDLLPAGGEGPVAVVGVVNSLLQVLRERGREVIPSDFAFEATESGDPVLRDAHEAVNRSSAALISGMTLGNGTFAALLARAQDKGIPVVVFAQSASAIFPWFVGNGVSALSAEPYPFFWLTGTASTIFRYRPVEAEAG